ncbi:MAG: hypothetical protein B0D92_00380 [Spirochaeta sp. LUC14_002_19_P3]|nr:MAG: hypothetical protein B0D92_00380 [Spirochaeta sp. LUC14_002_19_P3]
MNRIVLAAAMITVLAGMVFPDGNNMGPEGDWRISGNRLYQESAGAPRAKAWIKVPQSGSMVYEFTVRYEGGILEDGHGGVGIHILSNSFPRGKSWGMGDSWLLWLNYDENPLNPDIPRGLSGLVYKSTSNLEMELVQAVSLQQMESIAAQRLDEDIPFKLTFLADKGQVFVEDPTGQSSGAYVDLPDSRNANGEYVAVRTNGMKASFTSPDVEL